MEGAREEAGGDVAVGELPCRQESRLQGRLRGAQERQEGGSHQWGRGGSPTSRSTWRQAACAQP